ncbi:RNA polymerase sigma factor [Rhodobacterales bacterium HKCCE2091]|nr:RNA polymerase sigma factor [Rhodobacterales bacterium HKCCE2091]
MSDASGPVGAADPREEIVTHIPALRAFALALTRNGADADDMVQDSVVKAWTNIEKFEPGSNMRAWLYTILRNTYYSQYRKRRREVSDPEGIFAGQLSEKPAHDGRLQMQDFLEEFNKLPDDQREALILVGVLGESYEDAARACDVAVGTIKSRTSRARAMLAERLEISNDKAFELTDAATLGVITSAAASR